MRCEKASMRILWPGLETSTLSRADPHQTDKIQSLSQIGEIPWWFGVFHTRLFVTARWKVDFPASKKALHNLVLSLRK